MANSEHLAKLKEGTAIWNQWKENHPDAMPDLRDADLRDADIEEIDLVGANLTRVNLSGADLIEANLRGAMLTWVDFRGANLTGADLTGADLGAADLTRVDLSGANLSGVFLVATSFVDVDLRSVKGLESVRHEGPSHIGIDTIYRSNGEIPEAFLRGAGVPDSFITFMRSLTVNPIDFYSCFISYSSRDQAFVERLHSDLQSKHLRCWFAAENLKIGDRFQERIEESIHVYDKVMIVLSEASVRSPWVEREVNAAREREDREDRTVLFPIRLDNEVIATSRAWAADIRRTRHIGDFTQWKDHDSYQKAFARLLRDLQTPQEKQSPS